MFNSRLSHHQMIKVVYERSFGLFNSVVTMSKSQATLQMNEPDIYI